MQKENNIKGKISQQEEEILKFWEYNKIFEKSVKKKSPKGDYVFYDGPPFATGLPHYGHIVGSIMKDVVPRYQTMKGYKVERKWGWDCHGLPIENIVEKEMGSQSKKDIEDLGVDKFNQLCRTKILSYVEEWKIVINRLGRWADMENSYKTMDLDYMESVWKVFKDLYDQGLIYEGYRSMHICTRCETTLSQSEVTEGYKDIKDLSAIAKFELRDEPGTFVLAWTTTPWTLIGNVALAVGKDIDYVKVEVFSEKRESNGDPIYEKIIVAKAIFDKWNNEKGSIYDKLYGVKGFSENEPMVENPNIIEEFKGKDLIGKEYKPLFNYYANLVELKNKENGWKIYDADFVTTEDGTGVVHIAPAFGEDDMTLGKDNDLPFVQHVEMNGIIKKEATDFAGLNVKQRDNHMATDIEVIKFLAHSGTLFHKEKYEHSYPHCWRCDTPLINYATTSWFVAVTKIKNELLKEAKNINWSPAHIKDGRFGNWLEGARDWSISRQRFWASVMPIWKCQSCGEMKVFGSVKDLEEISGEKIKDLHKDVVDKIKFDCDKCSGEMERIPDVLDTWFDSGAMPYAQMHYPFENKEKFEKNFPAEFIAEGADQTRAWFYYLHVIGVGIKKSYAYKNVIVNGIVLAEDGKKMAKKLQNYPDPSLVLDKYGADALRYYLLTSPIMLAENLNFSERGVDEVLKKVLMILNNVLSFYKLFDDQLAVVGDKEPKSKNVLDEWILSRLNKTVEEVTSNMDEYNLVKASRPIGELITDLSTWYVRRSRDRFKGEDEADKQSALQTLKYTLLTLSKIIAPSMPFMAEKIYKDVDGEKESVHLEDWPKTGKIQDDVISNMELTRDIIEKALAKRAELQIKVKQPLSRVTIPEESRLSVEYINLIKDELNVKNVDYHIKMESGKFKFAGGEVVFDTTITPELRQEGILRELVRFINGLRKNASFTIEDSINIYWESESNLIKDSLSKFEKELKKDTLADDITNKKIDLPENQNKLVAIDGEDIWLGVEKNNK
jgi:isoleucyl-tRNA synthetase